MQMLMRATGWILVFTCCHVFNPIIAYAQIGIKAGPTLSDVAFFLNGQPPYLGYEVDYLEHRLPAHHLHAGVYTLLDLADRFSFQPELLFTLQG